MTRILLVGDNSEGIESVRSALAPHGYDLTVTRTVAAGLAETRRKKSDLIVLDLSRPSFDGNRLLRRVREIDDDTPVLLVNASSNEEEKVRALRLGADDYLAKPVGLNELLARVEALLRRRMRSFIPKWTPVEPVIRHFGMVEVNVTSLQVWRAGAPIPLRPREADLLLALMEREGRVVSRRELLERVWGYEREVTSRTVDNHIAKLRRKLEENAARPKHIISVRKKGYRFQS